MSQPLIATGRLKMQLTASGIVHTYHAYVKDITVGGSTYVIKDRSNASLDWEDAAQGWWDAFSYAQDDAISAPTIVLEELSSLIWVPLSTYAATGGNGSGTVVPAAQFTATFRDTANKKMKVIWLEGNFTPNFHATTVAAFGGVITSALNQYTGANTVTNPPYEWEVSRGERYLATSPFVAGTAMFNKKLRRQRGVA